MKRRDLLKSAVGAALPLFVPVPTVSPVFYADLSTVVVIPVSAIRRRSVWMRNNMGLAEKILEELRSEQNEG
ncbi:MAG: hypothetical protein QM496_13840 [Verrucomicrobiota bacterium]